MGVTIRDIYLIYKNKKHFCSFGRMIYKCVYYIIINSINIIITCKDYKQPNTRPTSTFSKCQHHYMAPAMH